MAKTVTTKNALETQALAAELAHRKEHLQVITLQGDLGAGKTTFTQGFARALGITKNLISPTFIIMRTYQLSDDPHSRKKFFYHVDLYRITSAADIEDLGILEVMRDPQNIVVIEWPEKIASALPQQRLDLLFKPIDENTREIIIKENDDIAKN